MRKRERLSIISKIIHLYEGNPCTTRAPTPPQFSWRPRPPPPPTHQTDTNTTLAAPKTLSVVVHLKGAPVVVESCNHGNLIT